VVTCYSVPVVLLNSSIGTGGSPLTLAVLWQGPPPQASASLANSYNAFVSGIYTLTAQNSVNGCTASATRIVSSDSIPAIFSATSTPFNVNCPAPTVNIYATQLNFGSGFTYTWTSPPNATVFGVNSPTMNVNAPGVYTLTAFKTSNGCVSSTTVEAIQCVGFFDESDILSGTTIFPNPSNTVIKIKLKNKTDISVQLINEFGQVMLSNHTNGLDTIDLPVERLSNGIYVLQIKDQNGHQTRKKVQIHHP
jgi:hypothetical protein